MRIKNELVIIKKGNKSYEFKNLILDSYLNLFAKSQIKVKTETIFAEEKELNHCFLKFDDPLEDIKYNSEIKVNEFDVHIWGNTEQIISENQIVVNYEYKLENINKYIGRKISAVGFSSGYGSDSKIYAVLDTSNYNIYINEQQDFCISRKDVIETDAIFYSNSSKCVRGPAHLCPIGLPPIYSADIVECGAQSYLYSIGFSSYIDYIDEEFLIGNDFSVEVKNNEIIIDGRFTNYLLKDEELFCNKALYAGNNIYPIKGNYKYLIFRYKVYQKVYYRSLGEYVEFDTGYYYHQVIPLEKTGKLNLKIKYERG